MERVLSPSQVLHHNEAAVMQVKKAAEATTTDCPVLTYFLPASDKWHVLNAALNSVSSVHAPSYMQADIVPEAWTQEWYVVAMLCEKKEATGRRFAGGSKRGDISESLKESENEAEGEEFSSTTKIQITCVKEETLQQIINGEITAPDRWQNQRHGTRFEAVSMMAALYKQQHEDPNNTGSKHLLRLSIPAPLYTEQREDQPFTRRGLGQRRSSVPSIFDQSIPQGRQDHPLHKARVDPFRGTSWHDALSLGGAGWTEASPQRIPRPRSKERLDGSVSDGDFDRERESGSKPRSRQSSWAWDYQYDSGSDQEELYPMRTRPLPPMIPESPVLDGSDSVIPVSPVTSFRENDEASSPHSSAVDVGFASPRTR